MMELVFIPRRHTENVWPIIETFVEKGIEASFKDRYTVEALKKLVLDGTWHLWVAWEIDKQKPHAIMMTELYNELSGIKVGSVRFLSGINRKNWLGLLPELERQMQEVGVVKFEMWARKGWARDLEDYKITHVLLEKDLSNGQVQNDNVRNVRVDSTIDGHDRQRTNTGSIRSSDSGRSINIGSSTGSEPRESVSSN